MKPSNNFNHNAKDIFDAMGISPIRKQQFLQFIVVTFNKYNIKSEIYEAIIKFAESPEEILGLLLTFNRFINQLDEIGSIIDKIYPGNCSECGKYN